MEPIKSERIKVYGRRRWRRENNAIESVDRISELPDSILADILSLIPTVEALATSTLSKRWRLLWRTVHNLHFCFSRFRDLDDANNRFVGFVNHVFCHLDTGVLNNFHLDWNPEDYESPSCTISQAASWIKTWIKTVITRNVRKITLCLEPCDEFDTLPISLFSCDSLQSLFLEWICLSPSTAFCLPKLERLHFNGVFFESDEDFEKIIRGCPVLNYLSIDFEDSDTNCRLIISSTSLRRLHLDSRDCHRYLKLDVPSLEHLKLEGKMSVDFVQQKLCSVVEAEFEIYYDDDNTTKAGFCNSMVDAVNAIERAKNLTLTTDVMEALSCDTTCLSADFERLVKLNTSVICCQWSSLQHFIQHSNNLEVLTIHKYWEGKHDHSNWTTPVEVPRCLSTSLKNVELEGYCGFEDEREMIGYILKHGSALEAVKIIFDEEINGSMIERVQEIHEYPRMSGVCKLKFFTWEGTRFVAPSG